MYFTDRSVGRFRLDTWLINVSGEFYLFQSTRPTYGVKLVIEYILRNSQNTHQTGIYTLILFIWAHGWKDVQRSLPILLSTMIRSLVQLAGGFPCR